jgi:hypothetical protein
MLALIAVVCFVLALFGLSIGVDLVILGLAFMAAHLAFPIAVMTGRRKSRRLLA